MNEQQYKRLKELEPKYKALQRTGQFLYDNVERGDIMNLVFELRHRKIGTCPACWSDELKAIYLHMLPAYEQEREVKNDSRKAKKTNKP